MAACTKLTITGGPLAYAAALDLEHAGYALAGLLVATWLASAAVWRFGRVEDRWNLRERRTSTTGPKCTYIILGE